MNQIIIIAGPTGTGKTSLGTKLAQEKNGEIINADSKQIYKFLNIGTNKGNTLQKKDLFYLNNIPIHLINIKNPGERYSAFDFQQDAYTKAEEILKEDKKPIIIGGTGLYISTLLDKDFNNKIEKINSPYSREFLESLEYGELKSLAAKVNPDILRNLNESDIKNPRRLVRVIEKKYEIKLQVENPFSKFEFQIYYPKFDTNILREKIEKRVLQMITEGLVEEVQTALLEGFSEEDISNCGIGYESVIGFLNQKINESDLVKKIQKEHKRYAIKQHRWFKKYLLPKYQITYYDPFII